MNNKYLTDEMKLRSAANEGNTERLEKLFRRAQKGERLVIAFLGGSITQGCLSSTSETCYAYLVYDWFVRTFPQSEFIYVNAGIGGTTSQFGAARLEEDVLAYGPDFCMVEYSVNDPDNPFFKETYESVISRLAESETHPALMIMHNLFYETGRNSQKQHFAIGKAYGIPCVSVRDAVYPEIESGRITVSELSSDGLHPNDSGHEVLAGLVCYMLEKILVKADQNIMTGEEKSTPVERRYTPDAYCTIRRIQNKDTGIELKGFVVDDSPKNGMLDIFKRGWQASKTGDEIRCSFTGTELAVQYRKTINKPAPVAIAVIDGDEEHPVVLDANFTEDWGDSLHVDTLLYHGFRVDPAMINADAEAIAAVKILRNNDATTHETCVESKCGHPSRHSVTVRIIETHPDDRSEFYLVSFFAG